MAIWRCLVTGCLLNVILATLFLYIAAGPYRQTHWVPTDEASDDTHFFLGVAMMVCALAIFATTVLTARSFFAHRQANTVNGRQTRLNSSRSRSSLRRSSGSGSRRSSSGRSAGSRSSSRPKDRVVVRIPETPPPTYEEAFRTNTVFLPPMGSEETDYRGNIQGQSQR